MSYSQILELELLLLGKRLNDRFISEERRREGADTGSIIKAKLNMMFGRLYSWFKKSKQCVQIGLYFHIIYTNRLVSATQIIAEK